MPDTVRENCPQAERQFRNAGMEGSFGAVQPKRHSCNRLMKVSCNVNSALKKMSAVRKYTQTKMSDKL